VSRIGRGRLGGGASADGHLLECGDCERWFWAETGEEVPKLFEVCATAMVRPERCLAEIREVLNSGGNGFPRYRTGEYNRLCGDCPNGRFLIRRQTAQL
jgi:hypothetical protein